MPVHLEHVTSEVALYSGELPVGDAQLRKLAGLVAAQLREDERAARERAEASALDRRSVVPGRGGRR